MVRDLDEFVAFNNKAPRGRGDTSGIGDYCARGTEYWSNTVVANVVVWFAWLPFASIENLWNEILKKIMYVKHEFVCAKTSFSEKKIGKAFVMKEIIS